MNFSDDLPDDVLSRSLLHCGAVSSLAASAASRVLLNVATVTAHRLFATLFSDACPPEHLLKSRPRLFLLLDQARSEHALAIKESFVFAATFGYNCYIEAAVRRWSERDGPILGSLINNHVGDGSTALCQAAKQQRAQTVRALLALGADPSVCSKNAGAFPLHYAARNADVGIVQQLLEHRASPSVANKKGDSPLIAALRGPPGHSRTETLRFLCDSLDEEDKSSAPIVKALLAACDSGVVPYVEVMISAGIGPTEPPNNTATAGAAGAAAPAAAAQARPGAAQAGGARPTTPGRQRRPMSAAARGNRAPAPGERGAAVATNADDWKETTPLINACLAGHTDIVAYLLAHDTRSRAMISAALPSGKSALYLAAEKGHARICTFLLEANASLDTTTCTGRSSLFAAVEHAHPETVAAICVHADVRHILKQTPSGVSPFSLAEKRGKPSLIVPMLECYHRQVRKRYLLRQFGDATDDVTDPYLTNMCLKFKDYLFQQQEEAQAEPRTAAVGGLSKTQRLARKKTTKERPASTGPSSSAQESRYSRVMNQTLSAGEGQQGRGRLRSQLDLGKDGNDGSVTQSVTQVRPPTGKAPGWVPSGHRGSASSSKQRTKSPGRSASSTAPVVKRSMSQPTALPRISRHDQVPSEEMRAHLQRHTELPDHIGDISTASASALANGSGERSLTPEDRKSKTIGCADVFRVSTSSMPRVSMEDLRASLNAEAMRREEEAMAADDAMEDLLADFLDGADDDDEYGESPHKNAMYASDSDSAA